jgi:hypothetical protein
VENNASIAGRDSVIGRAERDNYCAHLRVDVAEDVRNSIAVEAHATFGVSFVKAEVKALAVEEREDVVEERIEVREGDTAACGYD